MEQTGSTVTATYFNQNGETETFEFTQTTSTSASLASTGRTPPDFVGACTRGPGDSWTFGAPMDATAGALTYDEGTVFVTLEGSILRPDAGACGTGPLGPGDFWVACDERDGGSSSPEPAPSPAAQLPVGDYACTSEVGTYGFFDGLREYSSGGGSGTLALTQTGAEVTAAYSGDPSVVGPLRLTATTATTASAAANQSLTAPCTLPLDLSGSGSGPSPTPVTMPITAGSLAVLDSTMLLTFTGAMDTRSTCPGQLMATTLICSKQ